VDRKFGAEHRSPSDKGSHKMFGSEGELEVCERAAIEDTERGQGARWLVEDWTRGTLEDWAVGGEPALLRTSPPHSSLTESNRETVRPRKFRFTATRRQLGVGAAGALLVGLFSIPFWDTGRLTDVVFGPDLVRAGPLGEEALGEERAPLAIIEYASLTCRHCANFCEETFPALKANYIDTGRVRFILREFPLERLAFAVAVLARQVEPGGYFTFVQALLRQQGKWRVDEPIEPLFAIAREFGFTRDRFVAAFSNRRVIDGVDWVRLRAVEKFKVSVTPTFFIDGRMHTGDMSFAQMEQALSLSGSKPNDEI
jgi:hypothetical protein